MKDVIVARKGKEGRTYWRTIGVAFVNDDNIRINLDALPMPDENGMCSMFLKERKNDVSEKNEAEKQ
jgi:hypothetical protein